MPYPFKLTSDEYVIGRFKECNCSDENKNAVYILNRLGNLRKMTGNKLYDAVYHPLENSIILSGQDVMFNIEQGALEFSKFN